MNIQFAGLSGLFRQASPQLDKALSASAEAGDVVALMDAVPNLEGDTLSLSGKGKKGPGVAEYVPPAPTKNSYNPNGYL